MGPWFLKTDMAAEFFKTCPVGSLSTTSEVPVLSIICERCQISPTVISPKLQMEKCKNMYFQFGCDLSFKTFIGPREMVYQLMSKLNGFSFSKKYLQYTLSVQLLMTTSLIPLFLQASATWICLLPSSLEDSPSTAMTQTSPPSSSAS